jgi:hypothetical protein
MDTIRLIISEGISFMAVGQKEVIWGLGVEVLKRFRGFQGFRGCLFVREM